MIKTMTVLAAAAFVLCGAVMAGEDGVQRFFPYETHVSRLDNGLTVVTIPMDSGGLVAYWSVVRTGSRDEYEPGHTGFAHFFEHMMFRGTQRFPADVYRRAVIEMGADANAFTTDDLTAFHLSISAGDLDRAMELESDRFMNLSYAEEDFRTEAGAVYGEYRKGRTDPYFALTEAAQKAAFHRHTYGHTTMGFEQDIRRMPGMYDYSRSFFSRYYRPENVILLFVGDLDPQRTLDMVRRHYGDWRPGYVAPKIPAEPRQTKERRIKVSYPGPTLPILWLGYKVDRFDPADRIRVAAELLAELAFGETSEVYRKLVLGEQVVASLQPEVPRNRDPGLFEVTCRVKVGDQVDRVLSELDAAVRRYRERPPDPKRLADAKSAVRYGFLMGLDAPDRVAGHLSRILAVTGDIHAVDRLFATVDAVTPGDVQEAARRYLDRTRRTVAVLRGEKSP